MPTYSLCVYTLKHIDRVCGLKHTYSVAVAVALRQRCDAQSSSRCRRRAARHPRPALNGRAPIAVVRCGGNGPPCYSTDRSNLTDPHHLHHVAPPAASHCVSVVVASAVAVVAAATGSASGSALASMLPFEVRSAPTKPYSRMATRRSMESSQPPLSTILWFSKSCTCPHRKPAFFARDPRLATLSLYNYPTRSHTHQLIAHQCPATRAIHDHEPTRPPVQRPCPAPRA